MKETDLNKIMEDYAEQHGWTAEDRAKCLRFLQKNPDVSVYRLLEYIDCLENYNLEGNRLRIKPKYPEVIVDLQFKITFT